MSGTVLKRTYKETREWTHKTITLIPTLVSQNSFQISILILSLDNNLNTNLRCTHSSKIWDMVDKWDIKEQWVVNSISKTNTIWWTRTIQACNLILHNFTTNKINNNKEWVNSSQEEEWTNNNLHKWIRMWVDLEVSSQDSILCHAETF